VSFNWAKDCAFSCPLLDPFLGSSEGNWGLSIVNFHPDKVSRLENLHVLDVGPKRFLTLLLLPLDLSSGSGIGASPGLHVHYLRLDVRDIHWLHVWVFQLLSREHLQCQHMSV